jgi:hypothetical protein
VKADRFSAAPTRIAAAVLAGLFFVAGLPAAGQLLSFKLGKRSKVVVTSESMAVVLARQVAQVQQRFAANRAALQAVRVAGGETAYLVPEVAGLIARTGEDLDQAIAQVGEPGLEGLRAWSAEKLRRIQDEVTASAVQSAALSSGLSGPRAVAVIAGLGAIVARQETVPAATSDRLLDELGEVVNRIFFLASHDDLEVRVWVGSTPAPRATFRFWPQGKVKGTTAAPLIIRTDGQRDHVLRGLYAYRAAWANGAVTEVVQFPAPAGVPEDQLASERLDLVTGSSFFCCRFNEQYCHHVADEDECRP